MNFLLEEHKYEMAEDSRGIAQGIYLMQTIWTL